MSYFNTIVIGSGPAGVSAAIYLKRAGIDVLVLEKNIPGGLLNMASHIENYPGYEKIDGPTLAMHMFSQLQDQGIPFKNEEVIDITIKEKKHIVTKNGEYTCDYLILACGRTPRKLGLPNEEALIGNGISFCALCDGNFFKKKDVLVVGGGNSALVEALYLANIANKVTILHRSGSFRGEQKLVHQVQSLPNIEVYFSTQIESLLEENGHFKGVIVNNNGQQKTIIANALFEYIGYDPTNDILHHLDLQNEKGYLKVNSHMETSIPGIYACGDIILKDLYQIVTATSEGAQAAYHIIKRSEE